MAILFRGLRSCRMFSSVSRGEETTLKFRYRARPKKSGSAKFLQDVFDCSYNHAYEILHKNPFLLKIDDDLLIDAANVLQEFKISGDEIKEYPRVLTILPITLEHHIRILKESGFPKVHPKSILYYTTFVKRKISSLKIHGLLPDDANVGRNFLATLEAPENVIHTVESTIDINSDQNNICFLRDAVLKCYLQWRLNSSREEIEYLFSTYVRLNHKSLYLTWRTLSIMLDELQFPIDIIKKNAYLIQVHPSHLMKIMEAAPYLAGKPIRDVLVAHPLIAAANFDNFVEIMNVLLEAGVPEEEIVSNDDVFHFTGRRVRERWPPLDPRSMSPEVKEFVPEERKLEVLVRYESFDQRVKFITSQPQSSALPPVASLNVLIGPHEGFEKYVKGERGPTLGRDIVKYLFKSLVGSEGNDSKVTLLDIRQLLWKNPNWRAVPLSEVKKCVEMLLMKKYRPDEILSSLTIVLYSYKVVKEHLENLYSQPEISDCFQLEGLLVNGFQVNGDKIDSQVSQLKSIDRKQRQHLLRKHSLNLCLYFLERDCHFSGDGIWFRE